MAPLPEGRVRIKLDHGGDVLEVDEDDVEKVFFMVLIQFLFLFKAKVCGS